MLLEINTVKVLFILRFLLAVFLNNFIIIYEEYLGAIPMACEQYTDFCKSVFIPKVITSMLNLSFCYINSFILVLISEVNNIIGKYIQKVTY